MASPIEDAAHHQQSSSSHDLSLRAAALSFSRAFFVRITRDAMLILRRGLGEPSRSRRAQCCATQLGSSMLCYLDPEPVAERHITR